MTTANFKFKKGEEVKCQITGYQGIIIGRTDWQTNCNTYGIKSQVLKDGMPQESHWLDEIRLNKVGEGINIEKAEEPTGGPTDIPQRNLKGK